MKKLSIGREVDFDRDLRTILWDSRVKGFNFIIAHVVNPNCPPDLETSKIIEYFTLGESVGRVKEWRNGVVALVNISADLESTVTRIRAPAERAFVRDLDYALYLGVDFVQIRLHRKCNAILARTLLKEMLVKEKKERFFQVWIKVPTLFHADGAQEDTWEWWEHFRTLSESKVERLHLVLELTTVLPKGDVLNRWIAEGISCVSVPASLFVSSDNNNSVRLPPAHQLFVQNILRRFRDVQFQISGNGNGDKRFTDYLHQLREDFPRSDVYGGGIGREYDDTLGPPLQPLSDNLVSSTYEIFEKDSVKYQSYELACFRALQDRVPEEKKHEVIVVCMVLGAGRGPLVERVFRAAKQADRKVRVYAVEKNMSAVPSLVHMNLTRWDNKAILIQSDMRAWIPPEKADIVVSELLGSFGDNELSPECLDGAVGANIFKADGISIPSSYSSYLCPIYCPKAYQNTKAFAVSQTKCDIDPATWHLERPYVVNFVSFAALAEPKKLFTFHHPCDLEQAKDLSRHVRSKTLSFPALREKYILHGFAGYFVAVLYSDVTLSIRPRDHTPLLFSWFPVFFPLIRPIRLRRGDVITVNMSRFRKDNRVWYEYTTSSPDVLPTHNLDGKYYSMTV